MKLLSSHISLNILPRVVPTVAMNKSGRLGLLLFSSAVIVTTANLYMPFNQMFRRLRTARLRSDSADTEEGELVVQGTSSYSLGMWKLRASTRKPSAEDVSCELEIINNLDEPVLVCWVTSKGELKHYIPVNDKSIKDKSVSNVHLEYTYTNDLFVCIRNIQPFPATMKDITDEAFLFCYKPLKRKHRHTLTLSKTLKRRLFNLRGAREVLQVDRSCVLAESDAEILDSTTKVYDSRIIEGFHVYFEPGVFAVPGFERTIHADIAQLVCLLPRGACAKLQQDTHIYINKSLTYGTVRCPIEARGCCYHPRGGADWLKKNGLTVMKEGCVEIFNAEGYLKSNHHWGTGGVLVHEFSHVFHNKFCKEGYDNPSIRDAYNVAMKKKLYDNVHVHGPQGLAADGVTRITAKAYACTNCMEFFAELSVAYLYAKDASTEYNKWFPFNRAQLLQHDPASAEALEYEWLKFESNVSETKTAEKGL